MSQKIVSYNRQVLRTRSWIFEALMLLLNEKPYSKISVSDITKKAGIARQTFYRNYNSKDDIVSEHLMKTINLELLKDEGDKPEGRQNKVVLSFNYKYMIDNRDNIKKMLSIEDVENRIRNEAKEFPLKLLARYKSRFSAKEYLIWRYKFYYQLIGCLQVFFDWFLNDMPMPREDLISFLNAMNIPKTIQYRALPNIVVAINEEGIAG
ncbi:MAG: TetR/AcrR family transcriptional regulator [Treponema sp.]|nr:TetR/AcrR family transcriptional regulator [Treponema sp.]